MERDIVTGMRRILTALCIAILGVGAIASCSSSAKTPATTSRSGSHGASASSAANLPSSIKAAGVLRVGTSPDFAPAEFYEPGTKNISGYDPALITAIASALGLKVEFVAVSYDGLIPGLQADRFDAVMSGLTDTQEREASVDFVDYMIHFQVFTVLKGNKAGITNDMTSVCGKRLAVETGSITVNYGQTVTDKCQAAKLAAPTITNFSDQTASTLALRSGRVDVIFRSPLAIPDLQKATNNAFETFRVNQIPNVVLGIGVKKGDTQLAEALLTGLKAIQSDGTYNKIMTQWGVSSVEFHNPGINLVTTDPSAIPQPK